MTGLLRHLERAWEAVVAAAATLAAIEIPARLVLGHPGAALDRRIDIGLTLLFFADLVVQLRGWRAPGRDRHHAAHHEARWILFDAIAALPLHLLGAGEWSRVLRLFKLVRVERYMHDWHRRQAHLWNYLRLGFFVYWLSLLIHWLACGWLAIRPPVAGVAWFSAYLRALYLCIQTVTTVGYGDITPSTDLETVYVMALMMLGIGVYGYFIGNVASMLANIDPAKAHYLENMERLNAFMKYRGIPLALQRRIRDYHTYLWGQRLGYDEATVLAGLPPSLMVEVSLFLKRDIIQKVPFFQGASDDLVRAIALQMRPVVYTPGDYVFRAGEAGRDMYFIAQGTVEVLSKDGISILGRLGAGDFFGEIALLGQVPRSASVRAVDYCDLYALDQEMFAQVLLRFPEFAAHVRAMAAERGQRG